MFLKGLINHGNFGLNMRELDNETFSAASYDVR